MKSQRFQIYAARNAALRQIRKTKGFLLVPVSFDDPARTKRLAAARAALGRNSRIITVRPITDLDFWQRQQQSKNRSSRRLSFFNFFDEAKYLLSSDGAVLRDADILSLILPRLNDSLAELDRLRVSTGLNLPAWIFLGPTWIMAEEEARGEVARAAAVFAKATDVRKIDAKHIEGLQNFYRLSRVGKCEPVMVTQSIDDWNIPQSAKGA